MRDVTRCAAPGPPRSETLRFRPTFLTQHVYPLIARLLRAHSSIFKYCAQCGEASFAPPEQLLPESECVAWDAVLSELE